MSLHQNPFVGLRAFESDESLLFFGRQQQTLELLQHLHEQHFVAIVGSSGSGKSSLIKAGLIPSLKAGYLIEERDKWLLAVMKPGQSPLYNLTKAIVCEAKPDSDETLVEELLASLHEEGADALTDYLAPVISNNTNVFLLVDQFEELFRFSSDNQSPDKKNEAIDFVNILLDIAQQPDLPVYIVITMRSDFIGDCAQFYGLPEAMNKSQYLVPRLSRMQLKNVITGPLSVYGAGIEQTLLNQLLNDTGDNPDQLPVLQHVLMRTWEVWKEKGTTSPLSIEDYKKTGTIHSALSQHAEEAYAELGNARLQSVCELLFKALTDKKLNARGVRRPQTMATLLLLTGATEDELRKAINTFRTNGRTFLMPPANVELTPKTVIDISHESLMRVWTRLIQWVEEESESEQVYLRLSEAALLYKQKRGGLWRNPELELALQWKDKNKPNAVWAGQINDSFEEAKAFLKLSHQRSEQEIADEKKEQRYHLRRVRIVAGVIGVIALVSIWLMIYAFGQKARAKNSLTVAEIAVQESKKNAHNADVMKNRAVVALDRADLSKKEAWAFAVSALQQKERADSLAKETKVFLINAQNSQKATLEALHSKDAALKETETAQKKLSETTLMAVDMAEEARSSKQLSDSIGGLAESRNLANKAIEILDQDNVDSSTSLAIKAYELNKKFHGPKQNDIIYDALYKDWAAHPDNKNQYSFFKHPVRCLSVIPGTNKLAAADEDGTINILSYDDSRLQKLTTLKATANIRDIAVSPDGKYMVATSDKDKGVIYLISSSGQLSALYTFSFKGAAKKILFRNNTSFLLLSTTDLSVFNFTSTTISKSALIASGSQYNTMTVSKSGNIYLADKGRIAIYKNYSDIFNSDKIVYIPVPSSTNSYFTSIAVDDSEKYIAIGTYQGEIIVFSFADAYSTKMRPSYKVQKSSINKLQFYTVSGNKLQLASASADQTIKLFDVQTLVKYENENKLYNEETITLEGHSKWVYDLAYSNDGKLLFSCGEDNKIIVWKPTMLDLYNSLRETNNITNDAN